MELVCLAAQGDGAVLGLTKYLLHVTELLWMQLGIARCPESCNVFTPFVPMCMMTTYLSVMNIYRVLPVYLCIEFMLFRSTPRRPLAVQGPMHGYAPRNKENLVPGRGWGDLVAALPG